MGMRPYAADCGALVLPLASKVKLRAPSKDLYFNFDDICIEIPRQARDDSEHPTRQARGDRGAFPFCVTLSEAAAQPPRSRTGLCPAARGGGYSPHCQTSCIGLSRYLGKDFSTAPPRCGGSARNDMGSSRRISLKIKTTFAQRSLDRLGMTVSTPARQARDDRARQMLAPRRFCSARRFCLPISARLRIIKGNKTVRERQ